jgi:hypothetical protein
MPSRVIGRALIAERMRPRRASENPQRHGSIPSREAADAAERHLDDGRPPRLSIERMLIWTNYNLRAAASWPLFNG